MSDETRKRTAAKALEDAIDGDDRQSLGKAVDAIAKHIRAPLEARLAKLEARIEGESHAPADDYCDRCENPGPECCCAEMGWEEQDAPAHEEYGGDTPVPESGLEALRLTLDELTRFRDDWLQAVTIGGTDPALIEDPDDREALNALDATCEQGRAAIAKATGEPADAEESPDA